MSDRRNSRSSFYICVLVVCVVSENENRFVGKLRKSGKCYELMVLVKDIGVFAEIRVILMKTTCS